MAIREKKKMSFGDSELEKSYKEYMNDLIEQAKSNSSATE